MAETVKHSQGDTSQRLDLLGALKSNSTNVRISAIQTIQQRISSNGELVKDQFLTVAKEFLISKRASDCSCSPALVESVPDL
jgi:hypothetical protein